ncbi:hypothetical protein FOTG_11569 [Fusarium oxysporum f. sp. vasinfectum 25433]|uniref:Uncharacterized protein n=1 Tax=Fusarium oxysporum f. sp. vasinfectum 25433 TaxID=1089449 RepID=X0LHD5_FUSOX|nr:hypothetical protein FOTG_11569 [Fusarium oxysporum f. sp. vasinfectum 25433]
MNSEDEIDDEDKEKKNPEEEKQESRVMMQEGREALTKQEIAVTLPGNLTLN